MENSKNSIIVSRWNCLIGIFFVYLSNNCKKRQTMKFILGLDPGIASIGWALILEAENDDEVSRIIDSNVIKVDFHQCKGENV